MIVTMFDALDADHDGFIGMGDLHVVAGDRAFEVLSATDADDDDLIIDFHTFSRTICGVEDVDTA